MKKTAIIMAGGSGERYWPLSRITKPKQLLNLSNPNRNMLQQSIDRIRGIIDLDDIFIITSKILQSEIRNSLPEIAPQNIIAEPAKRNTAPCLALGASIILSKYKEFSPESITVSVLTADQLITPELNFQESIIKLNDFCLNNKSIATIGIKPTRPETGFGYIEINDKIHPDNGIYNAIKFHEKPNLETAKNYLQKGNFLWNSGMFFFRLDYFINELKNNLPAVGNEIDQLSKSYKNYIDTIFDGANPDIVGIYEAMPDISIDYGLMELTAKVNVLQSNFQWDDLGTWDSLFRLGKTDINGNVTEGNLELCNVTNSIVLNKTSKKFITTGLDLDRMVIINTDDALMICPLDSAQDIKKLVNQIKNNNKLTWL